MMLKKIVSGACALGLIAPGALAAGVSTSAKADTKSASAKSEATPPAEPAPAPAPEPAAPAADRGGVPYIQRYKPRPLTWEVGLFAGAFFPSAAIRLVSPTSTFVPYSSPALEVGGRIAFFPLSFLGAEGEFALADGRVSQDLSASNPALNSNSAAFMTFRGHLVGQLPFWSIVPFVVVGGGALGATSQPLGRDIDAVFHFGGGVKFAVTQDFSIRADFREILAGREGAGYGGISFSEEALLGATFTFPRPKTVAPALGPTPTDADGDHVPDSSDSCPDVPALTADGCPPDTDGDGIADPDDYCPKDAGIAPKGCPDEDPDKDGVPSPCDQCPQEAGAGADGCPIRDADGDGILDDKDKCVHEPETRNGFEDDDGCPDEIPKEVEKFTGAIQGIQFVQGSAKIQKGSDRALGAAADVLKKYPSVRLEIGGHTSSEGNADFNQKLSEDRAEAVRQWFIDHGVPEDRVVAKGYGPDEPIADNVTAIGRAKNRRIEFTILRQ